MGATAELAARIAATRPEDMDEAVLRSARRLVLDGLAVAVAGALEEPAPRLLWEVQKELAAPGRASLFGQGATTQPLAAAYVNGAAMHVLDFEPMWSPANHATSTSLPAVLALAETRGLDGRAALAALAIGVEVQGLLRVASGILEPRDIRFHPPGAVGPLGAAAAAAWLLGLDAGRTAHALGIAASRTGSLLANAGSMTKCVHCGQAAAGGLEAALLAERGFTANPAILESPHGYGASLYDARWNEGALSAYGRPWRIHEPGYAVKLFPCQYGTHFGVQAALDAKAGIGDPGLIESATLSTPAMPYVDRPAPVNGLDGKFSFQYTVAAALLDSAVRIDSFHDARRFAPDMVAMLPRIRVEQDATRPAAFETMYVALAVVLKDGRRIETRCDAPRGYVGRPPPSEEEHMAKVRDCLSRRLDDAAIEQVAGLCRRFDRLSAAELAGLLAMLR